MKILKTILIQLIIIVVFAGSMFALNFLTGPIIEANNAGAEFAPLLAVMPEGATFDGEALIYSSENASASNLVEVPASVKSIYKEKNGLGYAIRCTAESDYSSAPMEITIGITADGKICGVEINSYNDTESFDFRKKDPNYLSSYIGKDSALADIGTVTGATYSSGAFKTAVSEAMGVLISNEMIEAGRKTDVQILTEMIPSLHTGFTFAGLFKAKEVAVSGNIEKAYKALNGSGYAFIVKVGENSVLALVNASGVCKVFDINGADVTTDNAAVVTEISTAYQLTDFSTAANAMLLAEYPDATDITAIPFETFTNTVYTLSFVSNGNTYYAFYSCPLTFEDNAMAICTVIDQNGAIVNQDVQTFLFGHGVEYLPAYKQGYGNTSSDVFKAYEDLFNGITEGALTDGVLVSGATVSSTAVKLATSDAFKVFNSIKGGQN